MIFGVMLVILLVNACPGHATLELVWALGSGGVSIDRGYSVVSDQSGNVMVGTFSTTVNLGGGNLTSAGGMDIFIAKYDQNGQHIWSKRIGGIGNDEGRGVAIDSDGNVVVTGIFENTIDLGGGPLVSAGSKDIFVASYSTTGNHRWSKIFGGGATDLGLGVAIDADNNILLTGSFQGTADFGGGNLASAGNSDIFLASYTAAGAHRWSRKFGSSGEDQGLSVASDNANTILITGNFSGNVSFGGGALTSMGGEDIFLAKFDNIGTHVWSKRFGGPGSDIGKAVVTDTKSNVIVAGSFSLNVNFGGSSLTSNGGTDAFLATLTPNGEHRWSKGFGGTTHDAGQTVVCDAWDNVVIGGSFQGGASFGAEGLTSAGMKDVFLASYDSAGAHRWSRAFGGSGDDTGLSVATDSRGQALIAGEFQGVVDFGGALINSSGSLDIFIAKYRMPWMETANLVDAVLILQILAGLTPDLSESAIQDIGDDEAIGGEELIYALRKSAGLQ